MKGNLKNKHGFIPLLILVTVLCLACLINSTDNANAFSVAPERTLTLKHAYILAVHRNGDIKYAKESYYRSTLLKWSAITMLLPDINLVYKDQRIHFNQSVSQSNSGGTGNIFSSQYPNYEYSFTLNQPILNLGALPAYGSAGDIIAQAKMNLNNVSATTLYDVALSYYTVLNGISSIRVDEKTYNESRSHLRLAEAKLTAGLAIITDVLQAKSQFYAAKQELISAKNALKSSRVKLASILGIGSNFKVVKPARPTIKVVSLKTYILLAYKNNPALKSLKYAKDAAKNETRYYETQYIPRINLTASYNALSNNHFIPDGSNSYWTVGAVLTMPILQGGTRIISIEKARSVANSAMYKIIQSKRYLKARVVADFHNIQDLKYEIVALKHEEGFAFKNYTLVEEEYKAGVATSVDVVTALAQLTVAQHNLLSAKLNYDESVLDLKKLIGSFKKKLISLTIKKLN